MARRNKEELRDELSRLMLEEIDTVSAETFLGRPNEEVLLQQEQRLKRIRELSAEFLLALKQSAE
jgi:hypothetical protein